MIRELGNVELFELCETTPKEQCSQCLLYLESRNCVLHLRTMRDLQRIQKKFKQTKTGCNLYLGLRHFHPCAHMHLHGSRCRKTCLHKTCSSTCHHVSERLLFPCFVFFLCLSCLYVLSHFFLSSALNFNSHDVENAEH